MLAELKDNTVRILDPMYRPGLYDIPGRKEKVTMEENEALADFSIIPEDCKDSSFFSLLKKLTPDRYLIA